MASSHPAPPGVWKPDQEAVRSLVRPLEAFLHVQASSGILLLIASVLALAWANSPCRDTYEHVWHTSLSIGVGGWRFDKPPHFWINDGFMVVFFFVVGLEIRREIHSGERSEVRRAVLPAAAAVGGMLVPAAIYFMFNDGYPARSGWGVPTFLRRVRLGSLAAWSSGSSSANLLECAQPVFSSCAPALRHFQEASRGRAFR